MLGTDGFGRSDTREKLREFFEVSREYIVIAALYALAEEGQLERCAGVASDALAGNFHRQDRPPVSLKDNE